MCPSQWDHLRCQIVDSIQERVIWVRPCILHACQATKHYGSSDFCWTVVLIQTFEVSFVRSVPSLQLALMVPPSAGKHATALIAACHSKALAVVKVLLDHGADPNAEGLPCHKL